MSSLEIGFIDHFKGSSVMFEPICYIQFLAVVLNFAPQVG